MTGKEKAVRTVVSAWACLLFLIYALVVPLAAQTEPARENQDKKHCLWAVRAGTNTIYLLGSIHLLKAEHYPLSPTVEKVFRDSRKLILELKLDGLNPQAAQQTMLEKARLEPGQSLQALLNRDAYGLLKERAEKTGIPVQALNYFKPWFVAITLMTVELQKLGYDARHGIDQYFARKAQQDGKEILGLETFDFQINVFDHLPLPTQELFLRQTMKTLDILDREVENLVKSWAQGDTATLEALFLASFREYPEVYQRMVVDRNRNWVTQIEKILTQGESVMIIVGAGHLIGKEGLVELLKARGHVVEQW